jgi:hypothetical protein
LISAPNCRQGPSGLTSPRLVDGASGIHESERPERKERYRDAKATERAGWTREVLAPSWYRWKVGKPNPRKPASREGRGRVTEPLVGNTEVRRDR